MRFRLLTLRSHIESCLSPEEDVEEVEVTETESAVETDREGAAKDGILPLPALPAGPRVRPLMDADRLWPAFALCTLLYRR